MTELRVVLTVDDFDGALGLYRDLLGMTERPAVPGPSGRVAILDAGRATLELADQAQAEYIDALEVGERTAGTVRLALSVSDIGAVLRRTSAAGLRQIAPPTPTPFGSINARVEGPAGVQLTLFQIEG